LWTVRPAQQLGAYQLTFPPSSFVPAQSRWLDYQVPANPALSWEYWNGKGWWKLDGVQDATDHLRSDGIVQFTVPADIQQTDVVGRTNFWVGARLVGGD